MNEILSTTDGVGVAFRSRGHDFRKTITKVLDNHSKAPAAPRTVDEPAV